MALAKIIIFIMLESMKKLPVMIFVMLCISAMLTGFESYRVAAEDVHHDLDHALRQALAGNGVEKMRQDSIRAYRAMAGRDVAQLTIIIEDNTLRRHLRHERLREVAYIACDVRETDGRYDVSFRSGAYGGAAMLFAISDQRPALLLSVMALMSLMWSLYPLGRRKEAETAPCGGYGGLWYDADADKFVVAGGAPLRLTPMQHTLMRMFFDSDNHTLTKQAICDRLWPRKPDASDTLYTLIRRLKPIVEANSQLKIVADRGRAYTLKINDVGNLTPGGEQNVSEMSGRKSL